MKAASWRAVEDGKTMIENNWLLQLYRQRFVSQLSGKVHDYYVVELADAVTVIAVTPDQHVILVKQFRAGSQLDGLEPPGGLVDPDEDVCEAAARELLEETGYAGDTPRVLATHWAVPSLLTSRISTVLIENAQPVADPSPDHLEELEVELVPAGVIPRMISVGQIHHALAVVGLLEWLISQLPGTPWSLPAAPPARGAAQFHIRSILLAIVLCAVAFAALRALGSRGSIVAIGTLGATLPALLWQRIFPVRRPILLRGMRADQSETLARFFALIGVWVSGGALAACIVIALRSLLGV